MTRFQLKSLLLAPLFLSPLVIMLTVMTDDTNTAIDIGIILILAPVYCFVFILVPRRPSETEIRAVTVMRSVVRGALWGVVYGIQLLAVPIVEYVARGGIPPSEYLVESLVMIAVVLGSFGCIGVLCGAASGLILHDWNRQLALVAMARPERDSE